MRAYLKELSNEGIFERARDHRRFSLGIGVGIFNPFMPNQLFHLNSLDRSISSRKGVWFKSIIITVFHRNSCL